MLLRPLFILGLLLAGLAPALAADKSADLVRASLHPTGSVAPGGHVAVVVSFAIAPKWHLYWTNPGDSGMPPGIAWHLPAGWKADPPRFPVPERLVVSELVSFSYHDRLDLIVGLHAPTDAAPGPIELAAKIDFLVCKEACIPGSAEVTAMLTVSTSATPDPAQAQRLAEAEARMPVATDATVRIASRRTADAVELTVSGNGLPTPPEAPFLPAAEGVFRLDMGQVASADSTTWNLRIPLAAGATAPERLAGLLTGLPGTPGLRIDQDFTAAVGSATAITPSVTAAAQPRGGLIGAIAAGLLGGLILNLMPCVLPVLALKVLSTTRARAEGRPLLGPALGYAAGVIATYLTLAAVLLILRAGGTQLGWGFQLQEPGMVLALAAVFVLLAANLAGAFEIGLAATRIDAGRGGSFLNGVLTTVVATPCGAPFASVALGFAAVAPAAEAVAVFVALGVGLAAPMVLVAVVPGAARLLPKPGAWMEDLKKVLAVPMLGAAGWMLWTFAALSDGEASLAVLAVGVPLLLLAAGAWGRYQATASRVALGVVVIAGLAAIAVGAWSAAKPKGTASGEAVSNGWQPWTAEREAQLRAAGTPYLIDFTAAWCLTCQANKRTTLHQAEVLAGLRERGVATLRADYTAREPAISAALAARGRASVPTYVLSLGGDRETVLPDLLTPGIIRDAIAPLPRK